MLCRRQDVSNLTDMLGKPGLWSHVLDWRQLEWTGVHLEWTGVNLEWIEVHGLGKLECIGGNCNGFGMAWLGVAWRGMAWLKALSQERDSTKKGVCFLCV